MKLFIVLSVFFFAAFQSFGCDCEKKELSKKASQVVSDKEIIETTEDVTSEIDSQDDAD